MKPSFISVIVSTYNSPQYLRKVLLGLSEQTNSSFEVVVADDGSTEETKILINQLRSEVTYKLIHAWHDDQGFRAAAARNNAVRQSRGDYLVFLDGDCVPLSNYIENQLNYAQAGFFVRGSRVMLKKNFTQRILENKSVIPRFWWQWIMCRLSGNVKRINPVFPFPFFRYRKSDQWYGVKTCNLAIWAKDFYAVNGFDESYIGWGHEDADLAVRLIRYGIKRKEGRSFVPVIHLWHEENDRSMLSVNEEKLDCVLKSKKTICKQGVIRL